MTRVTELGLWGVSAALLVSALISYRNPLPILAAARPAAIPRASVRVRDPRVGGQASAIVTRNPFRLERRPSNVPYGSTATAGVTANSARRPRFTTSGIVGPPWRAVLDGIPGRDASVVVRAGDTFGEFRVLSVKRDTVVIQAPDTSWTLTVRRP